MRCDLGQGELCQCLLIRTCQSSQQSPTNLQSHNTQHGRDHDDRDEPHGRQQHQPGRRGETEEVVAQGPPAAGQTVSAGDHSGGHTLH